MSRAIHTQLAACCQDQQGSDALFQLEHLDIKDLISRGHLELAYNVCETELDRLAGIKEDILRIQQRPSLGRDVGVCPQNSLRSRIVRLQQGNECSQLGCCLRTLGDRVGSVDHKR